MLIITSYVRRTYRELSPLSLSVDEGRSMKRNWAGACDSQEDCLTGW